MAAIDMAQEALPRLRFGLRSRLLLLAGLALLPALLIILYGSERDRQHDIGHVRADLTDVARASATWQRMAIDNVRNLIAVLVFELGGVAEGAEICSPRVLGFMRAAAKFDYVSNVGIVRPDGDFACTSAATGGRTVNIADRSFFREALARRDLVFGQVVKSRLSGKMVLPVLQPVLDGGGRVAALISVSLDMEWLARTVAPQLATEMVFVAFARDGTILARSPDHDRWAGFTYPHADAVARLLANGATAGAELRDIDDVERMWAFFEIAVQGRSLYLGAGYASRRVSARADGIRTRALLTLGLTALIAFTMAWLVGQGLIVRRVRRLIDEADRLRRGDLGARVVDRQGDEIGQLGRVFNRMAGSLQAEIGKRAEAQRALEDEAAHRRALISTLRQSNEMLQAVIDASPVAIVGLDARQDVMIWNRAAERITGYTASEVIGKRYPLVPEEGLEEATQLAARAFAGETLSGIEMRRRRKDGGVLDVRLSCAPLRGERGSARGVIHAMEDVTARNAVDAQLRQAQKMEAIGNLTGGIAHDFNNTLAVIIGNLDLVLETMRDNRDVVEMAGTALQAALRGGELTRSLLAFSRQQPLSPRTVDLNALVKGAFGLLRRSLGEDIEVRFNAAPDLCTVCVDAAQLQSAIFNLAVNSRDAMPDGGVLTIDLRNVVLDRAYAESNTDVVPGDYVLIEIADTGTGMPPETLARIFEPFFTTKAAGKGTGLGLSMVYGFVKQSGGHIKACSEPGHGTSMKLYLPRATGAASASLRSADEGAAAQGGGETILVVEDNADVRRIVVKQLTDLGYGIVEVDSGAAALDILERQPGVALLFTDIVMPGGMSGLDLIREVRKRRAGLRVLATSGFPQTALQDGRQLPPDVALLSKPYRKDELARSIRRALRGQETE